MRDLAVRSVVAAMVGAGVLLGGAGIAVADTPGAVDASSVSSSSSTTATTTTASPTTTTAHETTTSSSESTTSSSESTTSSSESTTSSSESTTSSSETTTSSSGTTTSSSGTTTSSSPTTTHPGQSPGTATAQQGCLGEVTVVVSGTGLAEGAVVLVQVSVGEQTLTDEAEVIGGRIGVVLVPAALQGVDTVGVLVQQPGSDAVYVYDVAVQPLTDVCTAEGSIALARDCATPDSVLATIEASGLTAGGTYGIAVVGTSPSGEDVVLASADVLSEDGTLAGTLPLVSATGTVPLDGFGGLALLVDGQVFASVGATEAVVGTCVVPQPLPVAPVAPVAPVHPVASTTPAAAAHPAQPAALAQTGVEASSLLLLAGAFLVVGGLATLLARRTAR